MVYQRCEDKWTTTFEDLSDEVKDRGFSDFSPKGITSFFTFRYPVQENTMFDGYFSVPCGYQVLNNAIEPFWTPAYSTNTNVAFEQALEKTEQLLISAVERLCEGKERIGIAVSGGLDSSLICALVRSLYPDKRVHTYSAGFIGDDEFKYGRKVSKMLTTVHKEVVLCKNDFVGEASLLRPLIMQKAAPLHPNEIALARVEKLAVADGCDLVLCGEGGDDVFGGYGQLLRMYLNYPGGIPFSEFFLNNYRYFTTDEQHKLIKDKYIVDDVSLIENIFSDPNGPKDIRDKVFYFIQRIHTPGLILRGTNAFRYNSLPPAFPYLDSLLVDFVNSLPFDYKVHWTAIGGENKAKLLSFREVSGKLDVPKYLLKKIAEKYLPTEIIYRTKKGFPVPFNEWLSDLTTWSLNNRVFKTKDIGYLNGWKKFMVINLNAFLECFEPFMLST